MCAKKLSVVVVVLLVVLRFTFAQDSCTHANGSEGECVPIRSCPEALELLKKKMKTEICRFENDSPIVCCPPPVRNEPIIGAKSKQQCNDTYLVHNWGLPPHAWPKKAIVGGKDAQLGEFPHMAVLGFGDETDIKWACGGSLISNKFVLTAGHCIRNKELGEVNYVRLGDLELQSTKDGAAPQDYKVARRIRHPDYKPPSQYHDIALIELDENVTLTGNIMPACLNTEIKRNEFFLVATGWGNLQYGGESADRLQKVDLSPVTHEDCQKFYADISKRRLANGIVEDWQMCAGGNMKDTCQGDSGGPLQVRNYEYRLGYTILGVTSFGIACGISDNPGVYVRVANYIPWIESIVWPN